MKCGIEAENTDCKNVSQMEVAKALSNTTDATPKMPTDAQIIGVMKGRPIGVP